MDAEIKLLFKNNYVFKKSQLGVVFKTPDQKPGDHKFHFCLRHDPTLPESQKEGN